MCFFSPLQYILHILSIIRQFSIFKTQRNALERDEARAEEKSVGKRRVGVEMESSRRSPPFGAEEFLESRFAVVDVSRFFFFCEVDGG